MLQRYRKGQEGTSSRYQGGKACLWGGGKGKSVLKRLRFLYSFSLKKCHKEKKIMSKDKYGSKFSAPRTHVVSD